MTGHRRRGLGFTLATLALAAIVLTGADRGTSHAYEATSPSGDTLRVRLASTSAAGHGEHGLGTMVMGYYSVHGLPPVEGMIVVTDTGLVFRSADGRLDRTLPLVGPVRRSAQGSWRASAVSLAYVDTSLGRPAYLFRVEGGVFETDAPGALLDVAQHPEWLDSLASREWTAERALVTSDDDASVWVVMAGVTTGAYADSLYAIFGRPSRPAGLVGAHGRAAGRLGEYVSSRDSLALDPARITSSEQLRHTLAHELAHRWQARASRQLAMLWQGVRPIRDPKRYGYGNVSEHQAEAAAFAIHFLLSTAASRDQASAAVTLDHYELLVPGTRTLARYFALQPVFARHPLRGWLLGAPAAS
ncbi:MAG TPA: hypothetical protein VJQ46_07170 [Gemmatimonadales bacterium]|nr:hypothetical protein [Gemmatimonadales bacterium]